MTKLSDSQLVVLSDACKRDDRCVFPVTRKLKGNAAGNVLKSLLAKGLLEEIPGQSDDTVWRHSDDGPLTLRATDAALTALGIEIGARAKGESATTAETAKPAKNAKSKKGRTAAKKAANGKKKGKAGTPRAARADSKQARLIEMLKRRGGASIDEIVKAFRWRPHTVRGAIAGALKKKLGLNVSSEKVEGRGRVYRIAG